MSETISRRKWLYVGAAGVAVLAGAGLGAARWSASGQTQEADAKALAQLWSLSFDTPTGTKLAMQSFRGKALLLNFWATWCPPCVDELPMLNRVYSEGQGLQIVGIAVDQLAPVQTFLKRLPLAFPVAIANMDGLVLSKALGNQAGGLPFSVLIGGSGADATVLARKIGRLSPEDLARWGKLG